MRGARRARAWRAGNRRFRVAVRTLRLRVDIVVNGRRRRKEENIFQSSTGAQLAFEVQVFAASCRAHGARRSAQVGSTLCTLGFLCPTPPDFALAAEIRWIASERRRWEYRGGGLQSERKWQAQDHDGFALLDVISCRNCGVASWQVRRRWARRGNGDGPSSGLPIP